MSDNNQFKVPTKNPVFPQIDRDYPIPEKENLLNALNHEKPLWMPNLEGASQNLWFMGDPIPKVPDGAQYTNMWGITYQYSEAQESATPMNSILNDISEWKEKLVWPSNGPDDFDFEADMKSITRNENQLFTGRMPSACFEQLHMLEGFEQALIDMFTEPEAVRELFETMVDFYIERFKHAQAAYNLDYVFYHDDWGTARGPFFSIDLFKETILPPTIRLIKEYKKSGIPVIFHNCGLVDDFVPYMVDEIGADGLQIQVINDLGGIIKTYGDRTTVECRRPDPFLLFDPQTTEAQIRELGRWIVDNFGAHVNPGAGAVCTIQAPTAEVYYTLEEEIFKYSLDKYRNL